MAPLAKSHRTLGRSRRAIMASSHVFLPNNKKQGTQPSSRRTTGIIDAVCGSYQNNYMQHFAPSAKLAACVA